MLRVLFSHAAFLLPVSSEVRLLLLPLLQLYNFGAGSRCECEAETRFYPNLLLLRRALGLVVQHAGSACFAFQVNFLHRLVRLLRPVLLLTLAPSSTAE